MKNKKYCFTYNTYYVVLTNKIYMYLIKSKNVFIATTIQQRLYSNYYIATTIQQLQYSDYYIATTIQRLLYSNYNIATTIQQLLYIQVALVITTYLTHLLTKTNDIFFKYWKESFVESLFWIYLRHIQLFKDL